MKTSFFTKALFFAVALATGTTAYAQQPYSRYDDRNDRRGAYDQQYDNQYDRRGFNPEARQRMQNMRIEQGIRNGQLTRREVRQLRKLQSDTDRVIYAARANGYTSPRERAIINDLQNRIDQTITWEKNDRDLNRW
ncbi:MAG: hypothetical protein QM669_06785 [Siphonobacter sp.]